MTEANGINASTTGIVGNTGTTFTGTAVTQYNVLTGGSTSSTLNNVAPSATSGVPVISQGNAAQPIFGTAVVAGGGTGNTSQTAFSLVAGGTTTTGAFQAISSVATGQVLTSAGTSTLPAWSASPTVTSVTFGSGTALSTYVEGTFTPTITNSGTAPTITYTSQLGRYTQIGNRICAFARIAINTYTAGTGNLQISSLPVTSNSTTNNQQPGTATLASFTFDASVLYYNPRTITNSTDSTLAGTKNNAAVVQASAADAAAGTVLTINLWYET